MSAFDRSITSTAKGERMEKVRAFRLIALAGVSALALSPVAAAPAHSAPGGWTNVSAIQPGSTYPEISTSAEPSLKLFGGELQVAWSQADNTNSGGIYVAALNGNGDLVRGASPAVTGGRMNGLPQLLSYQGQRALSFGGTPAGTSNRGQNLATSTDGVTWALNPGSLSATNMAAVSSGGGTVEAQSPAPNTLIWAGAPNMGVVTWHVGLAPTNPAQDADGTYTPPSSQQPMSVNVVYEASTQKTYAAYYSPDGGTFYAEIAPNYTGFAQVPGSQIRSSEGAGSPVPMAARAQGGVFIAFIDPSASRSSAGVIVRELNSGRTWSIANSAGATDVAMGAAANGRVWMTFDKGNELYAVQTDPGAVAFGLPRKWGTPAQGATVYATAIEADNSRAFVAVNAYANGAQNVYVAPILPSLTVDVIGKAKAGQSLTLRVRDGGAPVRNARVTVGNKTLKSGAGGLLKVTAPRGDSVKVTVSGPGYAASPQTIRLR